MTLTHSPSPQTATTDLTPPALGLLRLRIPGFARLTNSEQLQAAALAVTRDLGVAHALRIATKPVAGAPDDALVAYCEAATNAAGKSCATRLLRLMQPGKIFWVNAPGGYIVGERGAAAVEATVDASHTLPSVVAATFGAVSDSASAQCVLVNRDRSALSDDTLAFWRAASGVDIVDGVLPDVAAVELVAPPKARVSIQSTPLDRALRWCAAGAVACAALAAMQFALVPKTPPAASATLTNSSRQGAGALFERISAIAPDVSTNLQSATFAGGAWVLVLADATDAAALQRATAMLEGNGLSVQSTRSPSPRLRVALP